MSLGLNVAYGSETQDVTKKEILITGCVGN